MLQKVCYINPELHKLVMELPYSCFLNKFSLTFSEKSVQMEYNLENISISSI